MYHQTAGQNHNIKIAIISFENVAMFIYLGMRVTNLNLIQVSSFSLTSEGCSALNEAEMGHRKMVLLHHRLHNVYIYFSFHSH
jgi:hypothetical protein